MKSFVQLFQTRRRRLLMVAAAPLAVAAATVAGVALGGGQPHADAALAAVAKPNPHYPFSPSMDGRKAQLLGQADGRSHYVVPGRGSAAGLVCFVTATAEVSQAGCDPKDLVDGNGVLLSEERSDGRLDVFGYVPPGLTRARAGVLVALVDDRVLQMVVPRTQAEIVLTGPGGSMSMDVPGSQAR